MTKRAEFQARNPALIFLIKNFVSALFNKLYARDSPLFMIYFVISHQNV